MIRRSVVVLTLMGVLLSITLGGCATGVLVGGGGGGGSSGYANGSDARITAEINRRLVNDGTVSAMDIQVQTQQGVVTLFGQAPTRAAAERAAAIARSVPGVTAVRNHLRVGR